MMAWCNEEEEDEDQASTALILPRNQPSISACPSCGHHLQLYTQSGIQDLIPGLPAGVKFDPTDQEILEHLEAKVIINMEKQQEDDDGRLISSSTSRRSHPLIDEFIPTLEGDNGICYTHPEKLPGVSKDGQVRHFFHRPSKAYTTGTRKRRKVHSAPDDTIETRWHKTGKTRPIFFSSSNTNNNNNQTSIIKGFKKILVLYTNYGRQKKPEKTNWVMHQYHLGTSEEEKDGELVLSKVFYQTQPRQCPSSTNLQPIPTAVDHQDLNAVIGGFNYVNSSLPPHYNVYYNQNHERGLLASSSFPPQLIPNNFTERTTPIIKPSSETSVGFF